jgi:hypothetical protein
MQNISPSGIPSYIEIAPYYLLSWTHKNTANFIPHKKHERYRKEIRQR